MVVLRIPQYTAYSLRNHHLKKPFPSLFEYIWLTGRDRGICECLEYGGHNWVSEVYRPAWFISNCRGKTMGNLYIPRSQILFGGCQWWDWEPGWNMLNRKREHPMKYQGVMGDWNSYDLWVGVSWICNSLRFRGSLILKCKVIFMCSLQIKNKCMNMYEEKLWGTTAAGSNYAITLL